MRCCLNCCRLCFCLNPVCCIAVAISVSVIFGMFFMYALMNSYYMMFFPSIPIASLEHTGMYDYINDNSIAKRETGHDSEDHHEDYYYEDSGTTEENILEGGFEIFRKKRNISVSSPLASGSTLGSKQWSTIFRGNKSNSKTAKDNFTTSANTSEEVADEPDFHLSNIIMDSVFSHANRQNMTQVLGLCRKGADLKIPTFKVSHFPAEEAVDILNCINDIVKNITKTQICLKLDEEMNAYLRWLVLTGVPKETHKAPPLVVTDDFLFPSTPCAANNSNYEEVNPVQAPKCLVDKGSEQTM